MNELSLVERLRDEPENVAEQLRAMAGLSNLARQNHRFDEYLLAGADVIERLSARIKVLEGALEVIKSQDYEPEPRDDDESFTAAAANIAEAALSQKQQ